MLAEFQETPYTIQDTMRLFNLPRLDLSAYTDELERPSHRPRFIRVFLPLNRRRAPRRMLLQIPPHRCPIPTPMHAPDPVRRPHPHPLLLRAIRRLERNVRRAQHRLPQITDAVLDMVHKSGAVRRHADAHDVEAVHLVQHRREERAVAWPERGEAHGAPCRVLRAPLVVGEQGEVWRGVVEGEPDGGELEWELGGEVVPDVCWAQRGGALVNSVKRVGVGDVQ